MDYDDYEEELEVGGLAADHSATSDDSADLSSLTDLSEDAAYVCNSCGEQIVVPLDYSQGQNQEYVEDCPVCCNPNVIHVEFDPDGRAQISSCSEQDLN